MSFYFIMFNEVFLIYNVVLVLCVQQSDSVIHIYIIIYMCKNICMYKYIHTHCFPDSFLL